MNKLQESQMQIIEAGAKCIYHGIASPFMIVFSGFIPDSTLDSFWNETVDECF